MRLGIQSQNPTGSHHNNTRPKALKPWFFSFLKDQNQIVEKKTSTQQADRRKMTA